MIPSLLSTTSILLGCALVLACAERPTLTEASGHSSSNFTNGPASPGPVVLRSHEDEFIFLVPDFGDNLTASIGTPDLFAAWCDPTAPVTVVPYDVQRLFKPSGQVAEVFKSDALPVIVYGVGTVNFCPDLATAPVMATGTARFVSTDHDFAEPPSFGYRATGTVTLTGGGTAHFTGIVKWVTTGSGQVRVHSQVTLTPAH